MKKIYKYISIIAILNWCCTNPFSVREPEDPATTGTAILYETPVSAEVVLSNFRYSIIQKNIINYRNCFADSSVAENFRYKFIPDKRLESEFFENWTMTDEINYLSSVFNTVQSVDLSSFGEISFNVINGSPDSVQTSIFNYELSLNSNNSKTIYTGQIKMKLVRNSNSLWAIYYWEDLPTPDQPESQSWSWVKAFYRNT